MKIPFTTLIILLAMTASFSQTNDVDPSEEFAYKRLSYAADADAFIKEHYQELGLTSPDDLRRISTVTAPSGLKHERFQQYFNGLKVFGCQMILHSEQDKITHLTADYIPTAALKLAKEPLLSEDKAIRMARLDFEQEQRLAKDVKVEQAYVDKAFPDRSGVIELVYLVDLFQSGNLSGQRYFMDAQNGNIIYRYPLVPHGEVEGKGRSQHYGEVSFTVNQINDHTFRLNDPTRGIEGNSVFLAQRGEMVDDNDNQWDFEESSQYHAAIDAHYCTERFYDLMKDEFNWLGIDGDNSPMNSIVYPKGQNGIVNASWLGDIASFGNGDCHNGSLTTLEVVGHEFMHGITQQTCDLVYAEESGAINESMSDVFGKILEYKEQPNQFSWDLGHSFLLDEYTEAFRSFEDPNSKQMPYTYQGKYWFKFGNVHTNSSVGNHFFYRLVEGGIGVTEKDEEFNFEGIGMEKASQLVWELHSGYFTPTTDYIDYYEMSLIVGENLWGVQSSEFATLLDAWNVVGLPAEVSPRHDIGFTTRTTREVTCLKDEYYEVEVQIANLGETIIPTGDTIAYEVWYDGTVYGREIVLSTALMPNDFISVQENNLVYIDESDAYFIRFDILGSDYSSFNNYYVLSLSNFIRSGVELDIDFLGFEEAACSSTYQPNLRIQNNSCDDLVNPIYSLEISYDNGEKVEIMDTLQRTLLPGQYHLTNFELEYKQDAEKVRFYANIADDSFTANNGTRWIDLPERKILEIPYFDAMEDETFINTFYNDGLELTPYTEYQGESVFYTEGLFEESNYVPCPDVVANFNNQNSGYDGNVTFSACLDLTEVVFPELSYNLTMFRNANGIAFDELLDQSAIMSWEYIDEDQNIYREDYLGLEEGKNSLIRAALPGGTKGILNLHFYTRTGMLFNNEADLDLDVILMDNLSIAEKDLTNSDDLVDAKLIKIYPNPASDYFVIQTSSDQAKTIRIYNTQGTLFKQFETNDATFRVNTAGFGAGLFTVIVYDDERFYSTRIKVLR